MFPHHRFDKLILLFIVLAVITMHFTASPLGMRTNSYSGNIFQVYSAAFAGIFAIMLLCKKIKKASVTSYLGRYSIITLGIHGPLLFVLRPLVSRFFESGWLQSIVLLLLTLTVCLFLTPVVLRLMPRLVAQKDLLKTRL